MATEIEKRKEWLDKYFYIQENIEYTFADFGVIKRKNYFGVITLSSHEDVLLTLYDKITPINNELLQVEVGLKKGFYSLRNRVWIVLPICDNIIHYEHYRTIELIVENKHGLLDIEKHDITIPIEYEDVTISTNGDYLWVKKHSTYHFIRKSDKSFVSIPEAIQAYDTSHYMFVKKSNGVVVCVGDDGLRNEMTMREYIKESNGRLKLLNIKLHVLDIVDLYGYILN